MLFSRKNIPLFCYFLLAMLSICRPKRKSITNDPRITEITLLELPDAGELYEAFPQLVGNEESLTNGDDPEEVYIHGIPFILKHKFYYHHKQWLPKTFLK